MLTRTWTGPVTDAPDARVHVSSPGAGAPEASRDWSAADEAVLVDASLERHRRQVYALCYRFVGNHEDASDLAQDVFVRAFRGLRGFKSRASLGTWLYRIAVNVSLNRVSVKAPVTETIDKREHRDLDAELPDSALLRAERSAEVRAAVAKLPRKQRATLILRVYHDLSHQEIADVLGSSVGAVKANFFHAMGNLKKLLQ
jgi:RNA polymerase sigma-70 factor (ECF subfamily)